ncbi:intercellular adhesion molecule 1 isoform X2 [Mirounga angustirostris]|uniref:intercellular adhesion molecule 1 isoform X2 n=1 Tax=Mirounga angustirostris TaxID=9716 RepID=UPI00313B33D4
MPEPSFRRGRREVSGKAAPPLCPPVPGQATIKAPARSSSPVRAARLCASAARSALSALVWPAMAPGPARPALPALLALIGALLPGLGGAQTSVHPAEAIIPRGGSVQVNCSTSCDQSSTLGLETQLTKKEVAHGVNWKVFELSDVQEDSHPICFANCHKQTMSSMSLIVYFLPETQPRLATPRIVEVGTQWAVNCTLDGLFPAAEAKVSLTLAEQKLHSTSLYSKDSVLAMANVEANAAEEGTQELACVVTLGEQDRMWKEDVTLYSFPVPNLTLSEPEVSEGTVVTVECEAQAGVVVSLSGLPPGPPAPRAQFQLNASAADHRRSFSCSAALDVAGRLLHKNQTRELHVLYGPRLDQRDCPGNWTWEEGSQQTLRCQAWGNPVPELKCHRKEDEALLPIGDLRPVKREVAGTYLCQARSPRGVVTREVVLNVTYHQNNMVIIILVAAAVILGTVGAAAYLYNRQRKIQKYRLQKAQEAATMKLNTPATPP